MPGIGDLWRFRLNWTGEPGAARATPRGKPGPDRSQAARGHRRRAVLDRTEKREFVSSLADVFAATSMVVVTQQQGDDGRRGHVAADADAGGGGDLQGREEPAGHPRLGWDPIRRHQAHAEGTDRARVVADPVAVAKVAVEFARTNEKLVLIGGALGTQTLNADGIKALAELPSLDALRGKILGLLAAPATRIAGVLQAPGGQLARVLGAYASKERRPTTRGRRGGSLTQTRDRPGARRACMEPTDYHLGTLSNG